VKPGSQGRAKYSPLSLRPLMGYAVPGPSFLAADENGKHGNIIGALDSQRL
jgi:hypothetical protein